MPFSFFVKYMRINFVMLWPSSLYQITNIFWPAKKVTIYRKCFIKCVFVGFFLYFKPLKTCAKPTSKNHEIILVKVSRFKTPELFCFMPPIHIYSICDITFGSNFVGCAHTLTWKRNYGIAFWSYANAKLHWLKIYLHAVTKM